MPVRHQADLNDGAAQGAGENDVECLHGGGALGGEGVQPAGGIQHPGENNGQGGDGADDNGIDEHLEHAPNSLLTGLLAGGGSVSNGCGAKAGLVGEYATGKAVLHGLHNGHAKDGALHSLEAEGLGKNGLQAEGNIGDPQYDNGHPGQDIKRGHKGHQIGGHLADTLYAADDHDGHDDEPERKLDILFL